MDQIQSNTIEALVVAAWGVYLLVLTVAGMIEIASRVGGSSS